MRGRRFVVLVVAIGMVLGVGVPPAGAQAGCGNPVSPLLAFGDVGPDLLQVSRDLGSLGIAVRIRSVDVTTDEDLATWFNQTAESCSWRQGPGVRDDLLVMASTPAGQGHIWPGADVLLSDPASIERLARRLGTGGPAVFAVASRFRDVQQQTIIDTPDTCDAVVLPQQVFGTALPAIVDQTVRLRRLGVHLRLRVIRDGDTVDSAAWFQQTSELACPQWLDERGPADRLAVAVLTPDAVGGGALDLFSGSHAPPPSPNPTATDAVVSALAGEERFAEAALQMLDGLVTSATKTLTDDIIASAGAGQASCAPAAIDPWDVLEPQRRAGLVDLTETMRAAGVELRVRMLPGTPDGLVDWLARQQAACRDWTVDGSPQTNLLVIAVSEGTGEAGFVYGAGLREGLDPVSTEIQAQMQRLIEGGQHAAALDVGTRALTAEALASAAVASAFPTPSLPATTDPSSLPPRQGSADADAGREPPGPSSTLVGLAVLLMAFMATVTGLTVHRRNSRAHPDTVTGEPTDTHIGETTTLAANQVEQRWAHLAQAITEHRTALTPDDAHAQALQRVQTTCAAAVGIMGATVTAAREADKQDTRPQSDRVRTSARSWVLAEQRVAEASAALDGADVVVAAVNTDIAAIQDHADRLSIDSDRAQGDIRTLADRGHPVEDLQTRLDRVNTGRGQALTMLQAGGVQTSLATMAGAVATMVRLLADIDSLGRRIHVLPTDRETALMAIDQALHDLPGLSSTWQSLAEAYGPETLASGGWTMDAQGRPLSANDLHVIRRGIREPLPQAPSLIQVEQAEEVVRAARMAVRHIAAVADSIRQIQTTVGVTQSALPSELEQARTALASLEWFLGSLDKDEDEVYADLDSVRGLLADPGPTDGAHDPVRFLRLLREAQVRITDGEAKAVAARTRADDALARRPED